MVLKLKDECRICLVNNRHVINLINGHQDSSVCYLNKLQACIPSLNITESDPYSKNICQKCVQLLDKSYEFYLLCLESDRKLRESIEEIIIKIETKDEVDRVGTEATGIDSAKENNGRVRGKRRRGSIKGSKIKSDVAPSKPNKPIRKSKCFDENGKRIRRKQIPQHECDICGRKVRGKVAMEQHIRIHSGERPCICEVCGKSYSCMKNYRKHLKIHNDNLEKKFKCTTCTYQTADSTCFKRHLVIHTTERPYKCDLCSKTFNRHAILYHHKKNIHSPPTIPCKLCTEKFNTNGGLRRHIVCHFREKQYGCTECKKVYANHEGLIYHVKRIHPGVKWPKQKDSLVTNLTVVSNELKLK